MKEADRYTVLDVHVGDLPERLQACVMLGLRYLVKGGPTHSDRCLVYVFFDAAGLSNYLGGYYNAVAPRQLT